MVVKWIKTFGSLIVLYLVALVIVFAIPNRVVEPQVNRSFQIFQKEKAYPVLNQADISGTQLDNYTDKLMIEKTLKEQKNPLQAAMWVNGYARYWHGYQIFLRPLLVFLNYGSIRQLYGLLLILLVAANLYLLFARFGFFAGASLVASLFFVRFYTFFVSMQFSNVFLLALLANLYVLKKSDEKFFQQKRYYLAFFVVGSVTNFIDLLTVPLVTLGLPLSILTLLATQAMKKFGLKEMSGTILAWGSGYGLTWLFKWLISSVILQKNVLADAVHQILFRTEGDADYPLHYGQMLKQNAGLLFTKTNCLLLGVLVLGILGYLLWQKKRLQSWAWKLCLFLPTPYLWYLVLANHSQIHFWFTYRLQVITIFALLLLLTSPLRKVPSQQGGEL